MEQLENMANLSINRKVKRFPCVFSACKQVNVPSSQKISYFAIRREWDAIISENLGGSARSCDKICSLHFDKNDMYDGTTRVYAKIDAVPKYYMQQLIRPLPEPQPKTFPISSFRQCSPLENHLYSSDNVPSINIPIPTSSTSSSSSVHIQDSPVINSTTPKASTASSSSDNLQNCPVANLYNISATSQNNEHVTSQEATTSSPHSKTTIKKKKITTSKNLINEFNETPQTPTPPLSSKRPRDLSPTSQLKRKIELLENKLSDTQKELYNSNRKVKRLEEKLENEKTLSKELVSKLKVTEETANTVSNMSFTFKTLFEAEKQKQKLKSVKGMRYSEEMKKVAVTIYQYSPKCYEFLRQSIALPHKSSIRDWVASESCDPGYNIEFLNRLQDYMADKYFNFSDMVLVYDEMSLRKCIRYCKYSRQFFGHVNYGADDTPDGDLPLASSVCVALAVSLCGTWKMPIGYIFTAGIKEHVLTPFVEKGIKLMQERGMRIHAVITDGHETNVAMFKSFGVHRSELGQSYKFSKSGFEDVCAIYDMCHLIKNWRGAFFECQKFYFPDGSIADIKYVHNLYNVQQKRGIRAANNINAQVMNYKQNIMKTRFAFKVFSKSCADGIEFASTCKEDEHLFRGSEKTVWFIRQMNRVIDILNSKNPFQKFDKACINLEPSNNKNNDIESVKEFLENFIKIIQSIKIDEVKTVTEDEEGKKTKRTILTGEKILLTTSGRKGTVISLTTTIRSIIYISEKLLTRTHHPFSFVMTYRFSSDHIELFFAKCRNSLGNNNNPTCQEFTRIVRYMWHSNLMLSCGTGNALVRTVEDKYDSILLPLQRQSKNKNYIDEPQEEKDQVVKDNFTLVNRGEFFFGSLTYICGYVISALEKKLKCKHCYDLLPHSSEDSVCNNDLKLINIRDFGGLKYPSNSCLLICKITDQVFTEEIKKYSFAPTVKNFEGVVTRRVLSALINYNIFPTESAKEHFVNFCPSSEEGHQSLLIKAIVRQLIIVRGYDFGNRFTRDAESTRRKYNKLNQFKESQGQKDFEPFKNCT